MKIKRRPLLTNAPLTSIGDIVFNLLIFFVILAKAQDDSHLAWDPATTPKVEQAGNAKASIVVDKEKRLYLNGKQVVVAQLAGGLNGLLGALPAGQRIVHLKVHKETPAALFEPIIDAVAQSGGDLVHILEEKRPEK